MGEIINENTEFLAKKIANLPKDNKNPTISVGKSEPGTFRTNVL
jgi:hypothetical protein